MKLVNKFTQGRNTGAVLFVRFSGIGDIIFTVDCSVRQKIHLF